MKPKRREPVPVKEAIDWYRWLGSWRKVSEALRRSDGSMFKPDSLSNAVRRYDTRKPA